MCGSHADALGVWVHRRGPRETRGALERAGSFTPAAPGSHSCRGDPSCPPKPVTQAPGSVLLVLPVQWPPRQCLCCLLTSQHLGPAGPSPPPTHTPATASHDIPVLTPLDLTSPDSPTAPLPSAERVSPCSTHCHLTYNMFMYICLPPLGYSLLFIFHPPVLVFCCRDMLSQT